VSDPGDDVVMKSEVGDVEKLVAEIARHRGVRQGRGGRSYPAALRERVGKHASECRARGEGIHATAARLGLSPETVRTWSGSPRTRRKSATFAPVAIVDRASVILVRVEFSS
jgi:hypothetical protein